MPFFYSDGVLGFWGSIDILVNNAGLMPLSFFKNLKVDEWDRMIDVNIKGVKLKTLKTLGDLDLYLIWDNIKLKTLL